MVCPTLSDPRNGDIAITTTTVDSSVSYTCRRGYRLDGPTTRECQIDGRWTGSDPVCSCELFGVYFIRELVQINTIIIISPLSYLVIDCGALENPADGTVTTPQGTTANRVARYFCTRGFLLVGINFRVCRRDNKWSGTTPTCRGEDTLQSLPIELTVHCHERTVYMGSELDGFSRQTLRGL